MGAALHTDPACGVGVYEPQLIKVDVRPILVMPAHKRTEYLSVYIPGGVFGFALQRLGDVHVQHVLCVYRSLLVVISSYKLYEERRKKATVFKK